MNCFSALQVAGAASAGAAFDLLAHDRRPSHPPRTPTIAFSPDAVTTLAHPYLTLASTLAHPYLTLTSTLAHPYLILLTSTLAQPYLSLEPRSPSVRSTR